MATLSSTWRPAASSGDRSRSPISRPSSPSFQAGESATSTAWRNALNSYRKSLSDKDFKRIMIPAGPEDVADEVEKWQCRQSASRYARVAAAIRAGVGRMQHFSASIDMLAQGSPSPGCLLWGSIKFVLTIVQDATEEYDKLCQALSRMVDCLPQIELYTETFLDSDLVRACVNAYYVSTLRFWTRACKFYRRHRLLNFIRVVWNDFDAEFSELEIAMIDNRDRVQRAALAEHISQAKVARVHQEIVNHTLLEGQTSARQKEITAWLAPAAYDVHYYQNDLANARALRHPNTCEWIFEKEEMGELFGEVSKSLRKGAEEESFLWIYAKPGAGKTILSSRLIDQFIFEDDRFKRKHVLYFFCKNTDADKNNATAVIRSLLFQLYKLAQEQGTQMELTSDLEQAMDKSGKRQAVDFSPIWAIFADYVRYISPALIVLDALDECHDAEQLLQAVKLLSSSNLIKIIATSRKEAHLFTQLSNNLSLEITAEDINSDILAYVEAKVSGSPRLSHSLVRDLVVTRLSTGHSGMFLWVYLTLKELKSCFSVTQVQSVLANLPKGLDGIYESILQRLRDNLPTASFNLCYRILTWVVSAVRPLRVEELRQALSLHHEIEGDTLVFEYADKDIELVCGSLVTVRQGTLQIIHLTVKEFLTNSHGRKSSSYSDLLIDSAKASLNLTLVCLKCIKDCCNESMVDLAPGIARLDIKLEDGAVTKRQRKAPLAEYASFTWMMHLIECDGVDIMGISKAFQATFESPSTFCWVEACLTFQPDSILRLLAGLEEAIEYVSGLTPDLWPEREPSCVFLRDWCHVIQRIFVEYGSILSHHPWEIYFLDLKKVFSAMGQLYKKHGETPRRNIIRYINGYDSPRAWRSEPRGDQQLQQESQLSPGIFFIHDERRRLYFWGDHIVYQNNIRLFVQNAVTGQRLPPAVKLNGGAGRAASLASYAISPSGEYIVLVYNIYFGSGRSLTLIWQINEGLKFTKRLRSEPWAKICFSHECEIGLSTMTATSVVFLDGGYCLTPSGEIHLASGNRRPLFDLLPKHSNFTNKDMFGLFFSQNGKYLFILKMPEDDTYQAVRVALYTNAPEYLCSWKDSKRHVADVSPSGRFLVLLPGFNSIFTTRGHDSLHLYDVSTGETLLLPFIKELNCVEAKFHFNKNETELIMFSMGWTHGMSTVYILVWRDLQSHPLLKGYRELKSYLRPYQIHINADECSALIVAEKSVIQRVDFRDQVTFPGAPEVDDDYPCTLSQISKNGVRWAQLRYGQSKSRLQMTDLSDARSSIHKLDLELPICDEPDLRAVSFSPNLDILVVDAQIYSITEGRNGLTSTSFTIQGLPELIARYRSRLNPRHWCRLKCLISPNNSYFICSSPGDPDLREAAPTTVYAFRVDLVSMSSARLNLQLPQNLTFFSANFHPSQPLMLLAYSSSPEPDVRVLEEIKPAQISIVELQSMEMEHIALPRGKLFLQRLNENLTFSSESPEVKFSQCGTFVVMTLWDSDLSLKAIYTIHKLNVEPVTTRYYPLDFGWPESYHTSSGEYVIEPERVDQTSYRLVSRKLLTGDPCEDDSNISSETVHFDNVICYPSSLSDSDRFILLGENDDEEMHLLIAPREGHALEIRPLSFSFNEAKRKLEIEWDKRRALKDDDTRGVGK